MASSKKKGLGKGLGALLGENKLSADGPGAATAAAAATPVAPEEVLPDGTRLLYLDPTALEPNPKQPRRVFVEEALEELSASIKQDGVQEPVLVRQVGDKYELISGERRVRASIMADVTRIPAVCREVSDRDMLKLGLIENIQREDLNAMELARGYQDLIDEFGWTQEELSVEVGKKRATITNTLRLLNLPEVVQEQVADGSLTMGHARALLAIESVAGQIAAARKIIKEGLSVRQAEKLAVASKEAAGNGSKKRVEKDPNIVQVEDDLRRHLGAKVALRQGQNGRGKIEIEYFDADELERLLSVLRGGR